MPSQPTGDFASYGRSILERKLDMTAVLLEPNTVPAQQQPIGAEPLAHCIQEHRLQVAAVDRELRRGVAGTPAERPL